MKYFSILLSVFLVGCVNTAISVHTTKSYEGHFYSKEDVVNAIKDMNLQKHESVWILSNTTLKRILKDCK